MELCSNRIITWASKKALLPQGAGVLRVRRSCPGSGAWSVSQNKYTAIQVHVSYTPVEQPRGRREHLGGSHSAPLRQAFIGR